jgi:hypothetical protein
VVAVSLAQTSFPALLRPLVRDHKTGVLRCVRGEVTKTVYVSEGRLIFATSTDPNERLGEILLRKGVITYRVLEDSVQALRRGKRQGTILVENGAIRSRDLIDGVNEQVRGIIHDLVAWEEGWSEFREGQLPSREVITLKVSTPDLILEGVRRIVRWSRIRAGVGPLEQIYGLSPQSVSLLSSVSLDKDELALVAGIDGPMTVEDICRASRRPDFWVCRILWALWAVGVLDRIPQDVDRGRTDRDHTEPHAEALRGFAVGREIERFNEIHRLVFELIRFQLREAASTFFERAFQEASREYPAIFEGVAVDQEGELDSFALRRNVIADEIAGYMRGLDRLLEIELEIARQMLGERKSAIVLDGVMAIKERQLGRPAEV